MTDQITQYKERIARLEGLLEINRSLVAMLDLRPLLYCIVSAARELTQTEASSILLVDRNSGQLHFEAATNLQGVRSIVVPMEGSIAGQVVQNGKSIVVSDVRSDSRTAHRQTDEQSGFVTRSILAVPLIARKKVIGVLEAMNKKEGNEFTDEDLELLTVLGDQAAVAVQNALLFQQSDLIAEMVHEMRTPLAAIVAYAELMQRPSATMEQNHQFADIILHEAERLNDMARSFLDLARLESGRARMAQDPVDISTVVRMVVNVVLPQADARQIGVSVELADNLSPIVGDAQRLHQAILNLLNNAVKYCRPGDNVTVATSCDGSFLSVSVADTGPGISEDALPRIFERFYRVPGAEDQAVGTGLGLTITRQIIEAHGGQITVSSEVGQGTTFMFTLPVSA
ncbi:MAG: GAF domain-containing sensor histidine kinase [Chloroflexota bacterium]|nr:GAF domain-containing sensor histidine kinase [Chloroflexota bacterium]